MPKGQMEETSWPYDEAWYRMRLQAVEETENEFTWKEHHAAVKRGDAKAGETGVIREWKWNMTFVGGEANGRKLVVGTRPKISSQEGDLAKILYEAFLGRPLEMGEAYDTDQIEGREADLFVAHDLDTLERRGKKYSTVTQAVPVGQSGASDFVGGFDEDEPPF